MSLFGGRRFDHLRNVGKKKQMQTFDPQESEFVRGNKHFDEKTKQIVSGKVKLTAAEAQEATINHVLSEGLDYKGQFQCFYDSKGLKTELSASVDPAQMFTGFVNTVITVGAGVEVAKQVMVTAHRGPMEVSDSQGGPVWKIQTPIQVGCLPGVHWKGELSAGIEVSVGVSYSVGSDGKGKATLPSNSNDDDDDDDDDDLEIEGMSLGFEAEAKAGVEASVGYKYDHFYAEDVCPLPCTDNVKARENLSTIIESGSAKAAQKRMVVEFINENIVDFGGKKVTYDRSITHLHRTSSDELIEVLKRGISNPQIPKEKRALASSYISSLGYWSSHPTKKPIESHVYISSHEGLASADVFASAKVEANAGMLSTAEAEAKAKFLEVKGSRKKANIKYQVCFDAMNQHNVSSQVVMTQETQIQYSKFDFTPVGLEVSAEVGLAGGLVTAGVNAHIDHRGVEASANASALGQSKKVSKEKKSRFKDSLSMNRMTYVTATVFWQPSVIPTGPNNKSLIKTLSGTGLSFGGSFLVSNLLEFYSGYSIDDKQFESKSINKHFERISSNLNISLDKLVEFMLNEDTRSLLYDLENKGNDVDVILLEVGYRIQQTDILIQSKKNSVISIASGEIKKIIENGSPQTMQLESVRIRFRIQDTYENEAKLFGLGIKAGNTSGSIKLKYVHDAGSEGIVDLHTVWMDPSLAPSNNGLDNTGVYEKSVPPVTLFCQ